MDVVLVLLFFLIDRSEVNTKPKINESEKNYQKGAIWVPSG